MSVMKKLRQLPSATVGGVNQSVIHRCIVTVETLRECLREVNRLQNRSSQCALSIGKE